MRILLLCSSYNGLTQRVWTELREDGHQPEVRLAHDEAAIRRAVDTLRPDLVLCPFLKERVPEDVWRAHRVVVIHPGPLGDRGPSSIDWAVTDAEPVWGVTALQAVEEMDAGPIWGHRTFPMPTGPNGEPPRKSAVYNGPVADAAVELAREVVAKAQDPGFRPAPAESFGDAVIGRLRPTMTQADRRFDWADPTDHVLRRIRGADGAPGVRTTLAGLDLSVFDAVRGSATPGEPGTIALRRHGAVLVRTGDGAVWIGHARVPKQIKLPTTTVLAGRLDDVPESLERPTGPADGYREITYRRTGPDGCVGIVRADLYNGAMSASQGHRLAAALRHAAAQDTKVVVLEAGDVFSNGIHLNVAEGKPNATVESWRNINAINDVCRELITCTGQLVLSAVGGPAGAGGVMLALGADTVLLHHGAVLNPHYRNMGLTGSEYWTYTLPRRVGLADSVRFTGDCLPVGHAEALRTGLVDEVVGGDRAAFDANVVEHAVRLATSDSYGTALATKQARREADEQRRPLETYRVQELAEMSRDMFDDRFGYAGLRADFVAKAKDTSFDDPTVARAAREPSRIEEPAIAGVAG